MTYVCLFDYIYIYLYIIYRRMFKIFGVSIFDYLYLISVKTDITLSDQLIWKLQHNVLFVTKKSFVII